MKKNFTYIYTDIIILAASIVSILLSFYLKSIDSNVFLPFGSWKQIPETCVFKSLTGVRCPFCGLTRSFINISAGDFAKALYFNIGGIIAYLYVLFQIPYRTLRLINIKFNKDIAYAVNTHRIFTIITTIILSFAWLVMLKK
ncbi:MAG: DUF2752 domain-containing protein [Bacillota bacterium]|nr:DUF2752 domain-containing protein [Bacillota bacterium]